MACAPNPLYPVPTIADFKAYFNRDFLYGTTLETVTDADITIALQRARVINPQNFLSPVNCPEKSQWNTAYLLLSAHYLCERLRTATMGINATASWLVNQRMVESVQEQFTIPDWVKNSKVLSSLYTTGYGAQYGEIIGPMLMGNIIVPYTPAHP